MYNSPKINKNMYPIISEGMRVDSNDYLQKSIFFFKIFDPWNIYQLLVVISFINQF